MGEIEYFRNHEGSYYDAMISVWKKMSVPVRREVMCIIDNFFEETPTGKSPWTKPNILTLILFSLDQTPKIKICYMSAKEHPAVIEGMQLLIAVNVIDSEKAAEDYYINHDGADSYQEYGSGLVGAGVI